MSKKEQLLKKLFGTESENESDTNKTKQTSPAQLESYNLTDEESGDVLEITVDNDEFVTPTKLKALTHTPLLVSPLPNTPARNVHLHEDYLPVVTITQPHTNTVKEPSTCTVKPKAKQTVQFAVPPIHMQKIHDAQSHLKPTRNQTFSANRFASAFSSRKRLSQNTHSLIRLTHANGSTQPHTQPQTHTQFQRTLAPHAGAFTEQVKFASARFNPYARKQNSHTPKQSAHAHINAHTVTQTVAQSRSHSLTSITRTFTQIHPTHPHSQTINSATITSIQSKHPDSTNTSALNSTGRPNTKVERQEPQSVNRNKQAPKPNIVTLNNKYVPDGVQLAIAVKNKKKLSKNALKRITRNLVAQL